MLPRTEFATNRSRRDGKVSHCRRCHHEKWAATVDKEASTATKFGLTVDELRALLERFDWSCAICGVAKVDAPRGYLMIDHDHRCCDRDGSCGQCVRGPLCANCNFGIGSLGDDADRLRAAVAYLEAHQGEHPHDP